MRVPKRKADKYLPQRKDATMTVQKYQEIKKDLEKLENIIRPKLAYEVKKHASDGDFSENTAYQIAKGKLRGINKAILEKKDILQRAEIIELSKNKNTVQIGNTVVIEVNNKQKQYQILGASETNPAKGIISKDAPLAQLFLGKKLGDEFIFNTKNSKKIKYKIIEIK